jgi:4-hydroxybenzoate polyprenyltransferase
MLATRQLFPGLPALLALAQRAASEGLTLAELGSGLAGWWGPSWRFVAAMVALGPLVGGATLLSNNYWDLQADKTNPRRVGDAMVIGIVSERQAWWGVRLLGATGLALALLVGPLFFAFLAACAFLSWAYSAPPLRGKGRAGLDVAINVLGLGVLCTFAGWSLAAPMRDFPWPFMVLPVLLLVSTYIPTTLVDVETDRAFGHRTIAVELGAERTFWVGFAFAVASNLVFALASALDYVVSWRVYQWVWPFGVLELVAYLGLRRWDDFGRFLRSLVLATASFGAGMAVFILWYTGWLVL